MTEPQQHNTKPDEVAAGPQDNTQEFREIGRQLQAARAAKCLSVEAVSRKVLLSPSQILALESGRLPTFYAPSFYAQSVQTYADFLGISLSTAPGQATWESSGSSALNEDSSQSGRLAALVASGSGMVRLSASGYSGPNRPRTLIVIAMFILLTGIALVIFRQGSEEAANSDASAAQSTQVVQPTISTPAPVATTVQNTLTQPPTGTAAESMPTPPPGSRDQIVLTFTASCWVQITQANGSTAEKVYSPQETLKLDVNEVTSLVIGNARSARMTIGTGNVDLTQFMKGTSDVARIAGSSLQKLTTR